MTPEDRNAARTYAWSYYALHADQRMKLFYFFLILSGAVLAALSTIKAIVPSAHLVALLPLLLFLAAIIFWGLDRRTRELVKNGEAALKYLDTTWEADDRKEGAPHPLCLFERSDDLDLSTKRSLLSRLLPYTYDECFRAAYIAVGGLGLVLAAWTYWRP